MLRLPYPLSGFNALPCNMPTPKIYQSPEPGPESRAVARAISAELDSRGWTQRHLADLAQLSESQLSRFLTFQKDLELSELFRVCAALHVELADLLTRSMELNGTHGA